MNRGFSLPELLLGTSLLALLAGVGFGSATETLARQRVEAASRRLEQGLEAARAEAERRRAPCGLSLAADGWASRSQGTLPSCLEHDAPLHEGLFGGGDVQVRHNLPAQLRVTANGLIIDGGTVVISAQGSGLKRCLVLALPLGVVRMGQYADNGTGAVNSSACLPT